MPTAEDIEQAAQRREKALELRIGGASFRAIAKALGVSVRQAHVDVWREMEAHAKLSASKVERHRELELQRIDRAVFGLWPAIQKGDPASVRAFTRLSERRSRLLGLDAPVKIAPTSPDGKDAYRPAALADAHALFDQIIGGAVARLKAQAMKQIGSGATDDAAGAGVVIEHARLDGAM